METLNTEQLRAVQAIEGPVMVIAGPGTGKTQILALRIAEILKKTDAGAGSILCLTFTNAGVQAMKKRLRAKIGAEAEKVTVKTFHSFAQATVEEFHHFLGFADAPKLLDDIERIALIDSILQDHEWEYLRPRFDPTMFVKDIVSTISLLKRDRHTPVSFRAEIEKEIQSLQDNPASIAKSGVNKGSLLKSVQTKIESLGRTKELALFYEHYEQAKKEAGYCDFNDILEYLTQLVEISEEVAFTLRERFLYVLVDEHQDSSGVQNEFLSLVWKDQETQNIFVVGDDRQLIYGFGGASLSYFEGFKQTFPQAMCITLIQNYRSTAPILTVADALLTSTMASGGLQSNSPHKAENVALVAADYERDEIIAAGIAIQEKIAQGVLPSQCAVLVPKNSQVRSAATLLRSMGLIVSAQGSTQLFDQQEAVSMMAVLRAIHEPFSAIAIAEILTDPLSGVSPIDAHRLIAQYKQYTEILTIDTLQIAGGVYAVLAEKIQHCIALLHESSLVNIVQYIAEQFFFVENIPHNALLRRVEVVRGFLHIIHAHEKEKALTLQEYLHIIDRFSDYNEKIVLPTIQSHNGVQVMTMHSSKGLEFDFVWVAHMSEQHLAGKRRARFTLPQVLQDNAHAVDEAEHKRKLYVAITRAKQWCTLSYPVYGYTGAEQALAQCITELPQDLFAHTSAAETEATILAGGLTSHIQASHKSLQSSHEPSVQLGDVGKAQHDGGTTNTLTSIADFVAETYSTKKVSVTALNNFFTCPWQWYFRAFIQFPEPQSENLIFGTIAHNTVEKIIQAYIQGIQPSDMSLAQIIADCIKQQKVFDEKKRHSYAKEVMTIAERFIVQELSSINTTARIEESVAVQSPWNPDLIIKGAIDLISMSHDDTVVVTDFKTGNTRKKADIERHDEEGRLSDYMRQLTMYSFLLQHRKKEPLRVNYSRLYFLEEEQRSDCIYATTIDQAMIDLLLQDIADYDNALKSGTWQDRPCHYKGIGGPATCPYCKWSQMW